MQAADDPAGGQPRRPRWFLRIVVLLAILLAAAALWLRGQVRGSLARLDGEVELDGLAAEVVVERDGLGIPTVRGESRGDVARGLGFVHAQDRFFQMDAQRRQAAGELAALVGPAALPSDRRLRVHRFRHRARAALAAMPEGDRALLDAYVGGVNQGLAALAARPWEYLLLRTEPEPWRAEDTVLAVYAMYVQLNDEDGLRESTRGAIHDLLGPEMFAFLAPLGDAWDSPITGEPYPDPAVPAATAFDLRRGGRQPPAAPAPDALEPELELAGSNNWAVAGGHTAHGGALLANDMHLPIRVPHVWYRAAIVFPDGDGGERRVTGVSLPGGPIIVAGSNGRVAWGFTNTWGDWTDLVELEPDPSDPDNSYRTAAGPRSYERHVELLEVKGGEPEELEVLETIWGPVIDTDHRGRRRALRWIAHDPAAVTFEHLRLEAATGVDDATRIANRIGAPPQNFVAADDSGRIGWTVMGPIPRRVGHDGRLPSSWSSGERGWDGYLTPEEYPRVLDPESGRLWTANGRAASGEMERLIGLGSYAEGARGGQIRDALLALDAATEADMLAIQLDDRALFLGRWRDLLLEVLNPETVAARAGRAEMRRHVEAWGGRAAVDSVGYRLVRAYRLFLAEELLESLTAACREADEEFDYFRLPLYEGPLWRLVSERPEHLLPAGHATWDDQLVAAADATLDFFTRDGGRLADATWGARNTTRIRHPFSDVVPPLARWLDMPAVQLPGDSHMPRYQGPVEGASQRLAVSPGREAEGYFHMPVGQSGHFLSPFYSAGHEAWVRGEPTPFLPGPARHALTLRPPSS